MSFLSILKSVGQKIKDGAIAALEFEAKALPTEQAIAAGLTLVDPPVGILLTDLLIPIASIEQIATALKATSGTGTQKLAIALPQVEQAILSDPLFKGKKIANLDKYNSALTGITGSLADLLDSFESSVAIAALPAPNVISGLKTVSLS